MISMPIYRELDDNFEREAVKKVQPFQGKTHTDAISLGLQLLNNRGFFDSCLASLVLLGDGEFTGGPLRFAQVLDELNELNILSKFVRVVLTPSPHTSKNTNQALREYLLSVCDRVKGLVLFTVGDLRCDWTNTSELANRVSDVAGLSASYDSLMLRDNVPYQ